VTLQTLGLTCWALVLAGFLGQLDVVFGTILYGRSVEGFEKLMFPLMNSVAVRTILHGSRSDMLKYVQDMLGNISDHQHFPLQKVKVEAGIGNQNLFETLFIYQGRLTKDRTPGKPLYKSIFGYSDVGYPICVEME